MMTTQRRPPMRKSKGWNACMQHYTSVFRFKNKAWIKSDALVNISTTSLVFMTA